MPTSLDWYVWRVVKSQLCSGLHEIEAHWSLDDLVMAHLTLDVDDDLAAAADEKAERDARKNRGT